MFASCRDVVIPKSKFLAEEEAKRKAAAAAAAAAVAATAESHEDDDGDDDVFYDSEDDQDDDDDSSDPVSYVYLLRSVQIDRGSVACMLSAFCKRNRYSGHSPRSQAKNTTVFCIILKWTWPCHRTCDGHQLILRFSPSSFHLKTETQPAYDMQWFCRRLR